MNVAVGITAAYGLVYALLAIAVWRVRRPRRPVEQDRAAAARAHTGLTPPAEDNRPGLDDALADDCALIYSLPAYGTTDEPGQREAFVERLLDAMREQQEGEQA